MLIPFVITFIISAVKSSAAPEPLQATCEWVGSKSGQTAACLPNWYINGVCQSKNTPSCKESTFSTGRYIHMIQCCQMKYNNDPNHNCTQVAYHDGHASQEICPDDSDSTMQGMYGVCGSASTRSCKATSADGTTSSHYRTIKIMRKQC